MTEPRSPIASWELARRSFDPAAVREAAPVFNDATVIVQPGAAHFPWIDDTAAFAAAVGSFLSRPPGRA